MQNPESSLNKKSTKIKPLRILVIEPNDGYVSSVCHAVAIGLSQILIGAVVMTFLMYSILHKDVHVALCTFAYHFFAVEAILSLNFANGWSVPMLLRHRVFSHVFLQTIGLIFSIVGTVLVLVNTGFSLTPHGISGVLTSLLVLIAFGIGPCALFGKRGMKMLHTMIGIPAFMMSSICLICAAYTKGFVNWATYTITYLITAFVIFYTISVLIVCFIKCSMRIRL